MAYAKRMRTVNVPSPCELGSPHRNAHVQHTMGTANIRSSLLECDGLLMDQRDLSQVMVHDGTSMRNLHRIDALPWSYVEQ